MSYGEIFTSKNIYFVQFSSLVSLHAYCVKTKLLSPRITDSFTEVVHNASLCNNSGSLFHLNHVFQRLKLFKSWSIKCSLLSCLISNILSVIRFCKEINVMYYKSK